MSRCPTAPIKLIGAQDSTSSSTVVASVAGRGVDIDPMVVNGQDGDCELIGPWQLGLALDDGTPTSGITSAKRPCQRGLLTSPTREGERGDSHAHFRDLTEVVNSLLHAFGQRRSNTIRASTPPSRTSAIASLT